MLETLSHKATLERGFALVRDEDGRLLRGRAGTALGQAVRLTFADGDARARIEEGGGEPAKPDKQKAKSRAKPGEKAQGDLF